VNVGYPTLPNTRKRPVGPVIRYIPLYPVLLYPVLVNKRELEELKKDFLRELGSGKKVP